MEDVPAPMRLDIPSALPWRFSSRVVVPAILARRWTAWRSASGGSFTYAKKAGSSVTVRFADGKVLAEARSLRLQGIWQDTAVELAEFAVSGASVDAMARTAENPGQQPPAVEPPPSKLPRLADAP